ncbi:MAG: hypothetical protein Q4C79_07435 [Neisseria sp.]|uniref:hypothetical protein n=1 Tax=Neisseria sp. TaxID=192066 RepID=UPI0026DBEDEE|nr:hypothetical protein [Neisseria sp.]MDO4248776.1 hypothetical protein [Neisseria sp.]
MKAKFYYLLLPAIFLTACASHHAYSVEAYSSKGRLLSKRADLDSNKEGIEMARQTLCKTYPNAIIKVTNNATGKEVERRSCR